MTSDVKLEVVTYTAQLALGLASRSQVVDWAVGRVTSGEHHPLILKLAGLSESTQDRVDEIMDALLRELGLEHMTECEAAMLCAAAVARQLASGQCEPIDAARSIWRIASQVPASQADLRPFIGLASEWDDDPDARSLYDEEIRSRALVVSSWSADWCRATR